MNKPFLAILTVASIFVAGCGPANQANDCGAGCRDGVADGPGDVERDVARDAVGDAVGDEPLMIAGDLAADVAIDATHVVRDASDISALDIVAGDASADISFLPLLQDCQPCDAADDCSPGYECSPSRIGKICLRECVDDGDCLSGFRCWQTTGVCRPVSYDCPVCFYDSPCAEGSCCDFRMGECQPCKGECQTCFDDYDCAAGMRCRKADGDVIARCIPECADGICPDPVNQKCSENGLGVTSCVADKDYCLTRCFPPTPFRLENGECVECVDVADCKAHEVCDSTDHYCRDASSCPRGEVKCDSGQCRQCCIDDDCLEYPEATGYCLEGGTCEGVSQCDGLCTADFPVCAVVQGVKQCVQCKVDADCALIGSDITCTGDPIYSCVTPDGGIACSCGSCAAMCISDIDCPPGAGGAVLSCAILGGSGICFDPAGSCGGGSACCAPGQTCYDLGELFWGLLTPDSQFEIPGGNATACSCSDDSPCLGETPCTDMSTLCKFSFLSGGVASYLEAICPDGQLAPAIPQYLCMDPRDFLTSLMPGLSYSAILKQGNVDYEQITRVDLDDNGDFSRELQADRSRQPLRGSGHLRGFGVKRCF